jgi:hypothetical protein
MRASQRNMSSSLTGPAVMPSGASDESILYSLKRRFEAEEAMLCVVGAGRGCVLEVGVARAWEERARRAGSICCNTEMGLLAIVCVRARRIYECAFVCMRWF